MTGTDGVQGNQEYEGFTRICEAVDMFLDELLVYSFVQFVSNTD